MPAFRLDGMLEYAYVNQSQSLRAVTDCPNQFHFSDGRNLIGNVGLQATDLCSHSMKRFDRTFHTPSIAEQSFGLDPSFRTCQHPENLESQRGESKEQDAVEVTHSPRLSEGPAAFRWEFLRVELLQFIPRELDELVPPTVCFFSEVRLRCEPFFR